MAWATAVLLSDFFNPLRSRLQLMFYLLACYDEREIRKEFDPEHVGVGLACATG